MKAGETLEDRVVAAGAVLTPAQLAAAIGRSESLLKTWRRVARGPKFFLSGRLKSVRYRSVDVLDWIADCRIKQHQQKLRALQDRVSGFGIWGDR